MPKVTELVSGGAGLEGTHTDMCMQQARTLTLVHSSVQASYGYGVQPARLCCVSPAGYSGCFCKLFQASFVSGSECGPELRHAGSLNEMAPKFLKWFNKTYTDCNVQFIVAHYCPQLGKMTSSRQYYFQLHDSSPLLAISPTHRAILFHNKAGGAKGARTVPANGPFSAETKESVGR